MLLDTLLFLVDGCRMVNLILFDPTTATNGSEGRRCYVVIEFPRTVAMAGRPLYSSQWPERASLCGRAHLTMPMAQPQEPQRAKLEIQLESL